MHGVLGRDVLHGHGRVIVCDVHILCRWNVLNGDGCKLVGDVRGMRRWVLLHRRQQPHRVPGGNLHNGDELDRLGKLHVVHGRHVPGLGWPDQLQPLCSWNVPGIDWCQ